MAQNPEELLKYLEDTLANINQNLLQQQEAPTANNKGNGAEILRATIQSFFDGERAGKIMKKKNNKMFELDFKGPTVLVEKVQITRNQQSTLLRNASASKRWSVAKNDKGDEPEEGGKASASAASQCRVEFETENEPTSTAVSNVAISSLLLQKNLSPQQRQQQRRTVVLRFSIEKMNCSTLNFGIFKPPFSWNTNPNSSLKSISPPKTPTTKLVTPPFASLIRDGVGWSSAGTFFDKIEDGNSIASSLKPNPELQFSEGDIVQLQVTSSSDTPTTNMTNDDPSKMVSASFSSGGMILLLLKLSIFRGAVAMSRQGSSSGADSGPTSLLPTVTAEKMIEFPKNSGGKLFSPSSTDGKNRELVSYNDELKDNAWLFDAFFAVHCEKGGASIVVSKWEGWIPYDSPFTSPATSCASNKAQANSKTGEELQTPTGGWQEMERALSGVMPTLSEEAFEDEFHLVGQGGSSAIVERRPEDGSVSFECEGFGGLAAVNATLVDPNPWVVLTTPQTSKNNNVGNSHLQCSPYLYSLGNFCGEVSIGFISVPKEVPVSCRRVCKANQLSLLGFSVSIRKVEVSCLASSVTRHEDENVMYLDVEVQGSASAQQSTTPSNSKIIVNIPVEKQRLSVRSLSEATPTTGSPKQEPSSLIATAALDCWSKKEVLQCILVIEPTTLLSSINTTTEKNEKSNTNTTTTDNDGDKKNVDEECMFNVELIVTLGSWSHVVRLAVISGSAVCQNGACGLHFAVSCVGGGGATVARRIIGGDNEKNKK